MTELWERQPKERTKAFELFILYRDMGSSRSLDKVHLSHKELSLKPITLRQIAEYSRKYRWVERANAYDDYKDQLRREAEEQAIVEMVQRQAKDTMELQANIKKLVDDPEMTTLKLTQKGWLLKTVIDGYEKAAVHERLSRGEPTEHIEEKHTGIDDLAIKLQAGREKVRKKKEEGN